MASNRKLFLPEKGDHRVCRNIVRKDELDEKLHSLIREKEARRKEILLQNEEKAREVSREFLK